MHKVLLKFPILPYLMVICLAAACTRPDAGKGSISDTTPAEDYHADNDIAMIVRSIADAMRTGEPIDTLDYNMEGVLTDGLGHPLYTDIQGTPGVWTVDVVNPNSVVIRNVYLGDLLPDDLENYLASSLNLTPKQKIETTEFDDDDEASLVVYDLDGSYLRLETRAGVAPNGLEGPLMSIITTKSAPQTTLANNPQGAERLH